MDFDDLDLTIAQISLIQKRLNQGLFDGAKSGLENLKRFLTEIREKELRQCLLAAKSVAMRRA